MSTEKLIIVCLLFTITSNIFTTISLHNKFVNIVNNLVYELSLLKNEIEKLKKGK